MTTVSESAGRAAELAARSSYGRLVAYLAARSRDVAAAEDALGDAFVAALQTWPRDGVPDNPEAWLLTTARRRLTDVARRDKVREAALPALKQAAEAVEHAVIFGPHFPDERLALLFLCAHPALDPSAHTPLMLQTVLGLDAAAVASAFLVSPAAMSQRLVRAKAKIREAGLRFDTPDEADLPDRLDAVLEAIYAAFGTGWDDVAGADPRRKGLADEAIWLGRVLTGLMPKAPEACGLLALMLHCEARRAARRDTAGGYVPLSEQDVNLWSRPLIAEAESLLQAAARHRQPGRFQLEAAIQSAHAHRAITGRTDWEAIAGLYEVLIRFAPTIGGMVGRAAAVAEARGAEAGLAALAEMPEGSATSYQPYWALAGHLHAKLGHTSDAQSAFERAIGLSEDPAVRAFLARRCG